MRPGVRSGAAELTKCLQPMQANIFRNAGAVPYRFDRHQGRAKERA